ncbi:NAD-dependent epimerase/dehydratase family protein [Nonomuraea sp. NPDC050310]|uniref:NAD-dependent epimerase/dehydratase family protein n=1 Tax=Nonomuraea sp. NPDC050310 TaxID=3154935 RepID=UPI0033CE7D25
MRVVVVGATGNVGTSLVKALERDPSVTEVLGLARRLPSWNPGGKTKWRQAEVASSDLAEIFQGADAVVHLAWLLQPTRDAVVTWRANALGSARVIDAVAKAGVPTLVVASSVGAYSPGPEGREVDESWPTHGWPNSAYSREKAYVERLLDIFERDHPQARVVRMRPGFIFKREAASHQRRLFAGPFLPGGLVKAVPVLPDIPGLRVQAVHADDVAEAYRLALGSDVRGAFNLAADPVLTPADLAEILGAKLVPLPAWAARQGVAAAWRARLVPASPGMFEMLMNIPVMSITRAHDELGWRARRSSMETVGELVDGLAGGAGMNTPPLEAHPSRLSELSTGVGARP